MNSQTVEIPTKDGVAPCHFFTSSDDQKRPAVIVYMDAYGIRDALLDMAGRIASNGYRVLLPNLYYRSGPARPFDPKIASQKGPEQDRMRALFTSINNTLITRDTASFLDFLEHEPTVDARKIGCVGYCMGGAFALCAAGTFPQKIAAAASLHGARLATDQPDSPHLLAPAMRGEIYVGIAGLDQHFTPEEKQRLESALQSAHVKHTLEVYAGAKHGFAINDTLAYDKQASELHWQRILKLFADNL